MKPTTVKDQIADMMRAEGYDFMTAYEHATRAIREFLDSGKAEVTLHCGSSFITLHNLKGN